MIDPDEREWSDLVQNYKIKWIQIQNKINLEKKIGIDFIREIQISEAERTEIYKSNNPDEVGGYNTPQLCCGISFQSR